MLHYCLVQRDSMTAEQPCGGRACWGRQYEMQPTAPGVLGAHHSLKGGSVVGYKLVKCRSCSDMQRRGPQGQGLAYRMLTAHLEKGCAVGPKQEGHQLLQVEAHAVEGSYHADVGLPKGGWQLPGGVGGFGIDAPALEGGDNPQVAPAPCATL